MFTVRRSQANPLLLPRSEHAWESVAAFNPSPVANEDNTTIYYRALSHPDALVTPYAGRSTIGRAESDDGEHFHSRQQVIIPSEPWDAFGCEDPRAVLIDGTTYVSYTALGGYPYGPDNIRIGIAVSKDGKNFTEKHLVTPFNAKAFALFPEKVGGKYAALLTVHTDMPPSEICLVLADRIEDFWSPTFWATWYKDWQKHALTLKRGGNDHVEVGASPVKTPHGWLFMYSYIQNYFGGGRRVFAIESALLDLVNPSRVIGASDGPLLVPEEIYEQYGLVPDIVFPSGALVREDMLDIYYGAADTTCAKASVRLTDLLDSMRPETRLREFTRCNDNPILAPLPEHAWEKRAVFNPAAIDLNGCVHILYRAMGEDNTSVMGYAELKDGIHVDERLAVPAYAPRADFEQKKGSANGNSGCEDPRLTEIDGRVYMTYTAYDGVSAPRGALTSISTEDFIAKKFDGWAPPVLVTPDNVDDKDLCLLPETIDGKYLLFHRISNHICADLLPDLTFEKRITRCIEIMSPRPGMWDSRKIGMAGPPIKVKGADGKPAWLLIYHGISDNGTYRLGAALLGEDGISVLARSADAILEPKEHYEREGQIGNVVFSCGAIVRGDTLYLYYGGADSVVGVATGSISKLVAQLNA